jgi:REP element-mobilizing transposase RayT
MHGNPLPLTISLKRKLEKILENATSSSTPMRARPLSFLPKPFKDHGGSLRPGRRKIARPLDPKQLQHTVLKSSRARGEWSMLHRRHRSHVDHAVTRIARRYGVRIYRYANVGNHLHLLTKTPSRKAFQSFLREAAGTIALIVTGAKKGQALVKNDADRGFWDRIAYTRIVSWGREFKTLENYILKNLFEAAGLSPRKADSVEDWETGPPE